MSKYTPTFLMSQEARDKYRARKRANQARYRAGNADYQQREAVRLDKRHHTFEKWPLNPANTTAIMWDGEAVDGIHYNLLQASSGGQSWTLEKSPDQSIGLKEALEWFRKIKREVQRRDRRAIVFVGYGTRYDWEMMILGEPSLSDPERVDIARQSGRNYKAVRKEDEPLEQWYPQLGASIYIGRKIQRVIFPFEKRGKSLHEKCEFQDIHTFFARSFVSALDMFHARFGADSVALTELFGRIQAGKAARGDFAGHGFTAAQVAEYNAAELTMAEWLWTTVLDLCKEIGIYPKSLAGPAPMARAAIERYGLRSHIKPAEYDTVEYQEGEWNRVCREAYKGGRIELLIQGIVSTWFEADLTSAYPSVFRNLPCLAHGEARHATEAEIEEANRGIVPKNSICSIAWRMPETCHFGAFPCRDMRGGIHYPLMGTGWHHADLVRVYQEWNGGDWAIRDMWLWESHCELDRPFEKMIQDLFAERQRLLAEGNAAEYLLKLCLNSMYGILAQMAGFARIVDDEGKTIGYKSPKYSNLYGAGKITAATQALLMKKALPQHDKIIAFATDAIYSTEPIAFAPEEITTTKELGKWVAEEGKEPRYFIAPGISIGPSGKSKTRGFSDMPTYEALTAAYLADAPLFEYTERRFQNILRAKHLDKKGQPELSAQAGRFVEEKRSLTLHPYGLHSKRDIGRGILEMGTARYIPPYLRQQGKIAPYTRAVDPEAQYVDHDERQDSDYAV